MNIINYKCCPKCSDEIRNNSWHTCQDIYRIGYYIRPAHEESYDDEFCYDQSRVYITYMFYKQDQSITFILEDNNLIEAKLLLAPEYLNKSIILNIDEVKSLKSFDELEAYIKSISLFN